MFLVPPCLLEELGMATGEEAGSQGAQAWCELRKGGVAFHSLCGHYREVGIPWSLLGCAWVWQNTSAILGNLWEWGSSCCGWRVTHFE